MKKGKISKKRVKEALDNNYGIITDAANSLGIHRNTLHNWINADPELLPHVAGGREELLDLAESQLVKNIKNGDVASILFTLKTIGRGRGYVERHEYAEHVEQELYPDQDNLEPEPDEEEEQE